MSKNVPFFQTFRSVRIKNKEGLEYNITPLVYEISIFEDLFSNILSGEMIIADNMGTLDKIHFSGNEKLTLELFVSSNSEEVEIKEFYVYSITNKIKKNLTSEIYKLNFISFESVLNEHTRLYCAFTGTNSSAVQKIFRNYIGSQKPFDVEPTIGVFKYVMPSWTPFEAINWYAGRSVSAISKGSYFLFYETMRGFNFKSVESLIRNPPVYEFRYEPAGLSFLSKDPGNIREFEVVTISDSMQGVKEHYTTLWTNDIIRKKIVKKRFEYEDNNKGKLNDELLGTSDKTGFGISLKERRDIFGSQVLIKPETRNVHSQTENYSYNAIQPKMSAIRQFSKLKIRFLTFGLREIKVGDVIKLSFLQSKKITESNKYESEDKLLSGNYLVTALRFIFKAQDFHLSIEAVKDSRVY